MILPKRGEPVDREARAKLRMMLEPEVVQERIEQLQAKEEMRLSQVFDDAEVHRVCGELKIHFRERNFTPASTLGLFISQILSRGDACSTVMTQFNRERKRQGLSPVSDDGTPY